MSTGIKRVSQGLNRVFKGLHRLQPGLPGPPGGQPVTSTPPDSRSGVGLGVVFLSLRHRNSPLLRSVNSGWFRSLPRCIRPDWGLGAVFCRLDTTVPPSFWLSRNRTQLAAFAHSGRGSAGVHRVQQRPTREQKDSAGVYRVHQGHVFRV